MELSKHCFLLPNVQLQVRNIDWLDFEELKVKRTLRNMQDGYRLERRGFGLIETESGGISNKSIHAKYVQKCWRLNQQKLSVPLDTLAIVAYEQPITKTEIDQFVRETVGQYFEIYWNSDNPCLGKKQETGSPLIYGTTPESYISLAFETS